MTDYVMRVTIFVPQTMIADANQLALCLGQSVADADTFGAPGWQDASGNLYAVSSTMANATFPVAAGSILTAPAFAPDTDLVAAGRAQAALEIYDAEAPLTADPAHILAIIHDSASVALSLAGVSRVPVGV